MPGIESDGARDAMSLIVCNAEHAPLCDLTAEICCAPSKENIEDIDAHRNALVTMAPADPRMATPEVPRTRTAVSDCHSVNSHPDFPSLATPENPTESSRFEKCHKSFN